MSTAPTSRTATEILDQHRAWMRSVGYYAPPSLAADTPVRRLVWSELSAEDRAVLRRADLTGAVLTGADLRRAVLTDAVLTDAVLTDAVLTDAVLTGADLRRAVLTDAVLTDAVLTDADLTGADLRRAVLTGADLTGADLTGAVLTDAVLTGADLTGADESAERRVEREARRSERFRLRNPDVPSIPDIDARILSLVESGKGELDMSSWHGPEDSICGTTHCRAGWAVHLAGEAGKALEDKYGPSGAGAKIYLASTGRVPDFHCGDYAALEDIRACAASQTVEP